MLLLFFNRYTDKINTYKITENDLSIDPVLVLSRLEYKEKLHGFWLGQCIANWTGLVTEMDKIGNIGEIKKRKNVVIAYEPVWSIGTGIIPKSDDLFRTINFIKKKVKNIKVLYGGSVNPKNINELKLIKNIDGFLIGGASQDPKKFIDIIKKTYN